MKKLQSMSDKLLEEDPMLAGEEYERYRAKLTSALARAEFRECLAYRVCLVSVVIGFSLMFVGGSRLFGSFDPWDSTATPLSIALGSVYVVATILFWVLLASYYSRFRPNSRRAQDALRDEQICQLERSVAELRELILASRSLDPSDSSCANENSSDSD